MLAQVDLVRQFIEHLVLDDRRFHVGDQHSLSAAGIGLRDRVDGCVLDRFVGEVQGVAALETVKPEIGRPAVGKPVRRRHVAAGAQ